MRGDNESGEAALAEGDARRAAGDWDGALAAYVRGAAAGAPPAAAAWRIGLVHHLRGDLDEALTSYAVEPRGDTPADVALLLAWRATAQWLRGDAPGCRSDAERALELARMSGDDCALATAHIACAMLAALDGDRRANELHYTRALEHAERASDPLLILRIRANRGSRLLEESAFADAVAELDAALAATKPGTAPVLEALALTNRGQAEFRLGRLEEALADLAAARALFQSAGSRMLAYSLGIEGDVRRERGELAVARAVYEEAIRVGEPIDDRQAVGPALCGLALVLAEEDLDAAKAAATRALEAAAPLNQVTALLAAAFVELKRGERAAAADYARRAAAEARHQRDWAGLAESLQLTAATGSSEAIDQVDQALSIWRRIGDPLGEARGVLTLARVTGGQRGRMLAADAERRLRELGARGHAARAAALQDRLAATAPPPVNVYCLGAFRVEIDGRPIPHSAWGSRRARQLLKVLIAHRGRPVAREALMELLWPDEDPARSGPRLSVALSTLRRVLDPARHCGADALFVATGDAVRLDHASVDVDVERFLALAATALAGDSKALEAAVALYRGDFLEEDRYEDWTAALRDEAREAYIALLRRSAHGAFAAGDHDSAIRRLLRILEHDPYDENAHLAVVAGLVAARRHGEARRRYRHYVSNMRDLGLRPAPFPPPAGHFDL